MLETVGIFPHSKSEDGQERVLVKDHLSISIGTPAVVEALLPHGFRELPVIRQQWGMHTVRLNPKDLTAFTIATKDDPAIIYDDMVTQCSPLLGIDSSGNTYYAHNNLIDARDLLPRMLEEFRRAMEALENKSRAVAVIGTNDIGTKQNHEEFLAELDKGLEGMEPTYAISKTPGSKFGIIPAGRRVVGCVVIPNYISTSRYNELLVLTEEDSELQTLQKGLKIGLWK